MITLFLLILIWTNVIEASHFNGGTITWVPLYPDSNSSSIVITVTQSYSWVYPTVNCGTSIPTTSAGTFLTCVGNCSTEGAFTNHSISILTDCTSYSASLGLVFSQRSVNITLNENNYFWIGNRGQAWRTLANAATSGSASWSIVSLIDLIRRPDGLINTPPVAQITSPQYIVVNKTTAITIEVSDVNTGDDLRCRWSVKNSTYGVDECADVCSSVSTTSLANLTKCTLTFTAPISGVWYAIAIQLEDFINTTSTNAMSSVSIQFLIYALTPNCSILPVILNLTGCLEVQVNVTAKFTLYAQNYCNKTKSVTTDILPTIDITGMQISSLVNSTTNSTLSYVTLTWTPIASQLGVQTFCAVAYTSEKVQSDPYCVDFTVVTSKPCTTTTTSTTSTTASTTSVTTSTTTTTQTSSTSTTSTTASTETTTSATTSSSTTESTTSETTTTTTTSETTTTTSETTTTTTTSTTVTTTSETTSTTSETTTTTSSTETMSTSSTSTTSTTSTTTTTSTTSTTTTETTTTTTSTETTSTSSTSTTSTTSTTTTTSTTSTTTTETTSTTSSTETTSTSSTSTTSTTLTTSTTSTATTETTTTTTSTETTATSSTSTSSSTSTTATSTTTTTSTTETTSTTSSSTTTTFTTATTTTATTTTVTTATTVTTITAITTTQTTTISSSSSGINIPLIVSLSLLGFLLAVCCSCFWLYYFKRRSRARRHQQPKIKNVWDENDRVSDQEEMPASRSTKREKSYLIQDELNNQDTIPIEVIPDTTDDIVTLSKEENTSPKSHHHHQDSDEKSSLAKNQPARQHSSVTASLVNKLRKVPEIIRRKTPINSSKVRDELHEFNSPASTRIHVITLPKNKVSRSSSTRSSNASELNDDHSRKQNDIGDGNGNSANDLSNQKPNRVDSVNIVKEKEKKTSMTHSNPNIIVTLNTNRYHQAHNINRSNANDDNVTRTQASTFGGITVSKVKTSNDNDKTSDTGSVKIRKNVTSAKEEHSSFESVYGIDFDEKSSAMDNQPVSQHSSDNDPLVNKSTKVSEIIESKTPIKSPTISHKEYKSSPIISTNTHVIKLPKNKVSSSFNIHTNNVSDSNNNQTTNQKSNRYNSINIVMKEEEKMLTTHTKPGIIVTLNSNRYHQVHPVSHSNSTVDNDTRNRASSFGGITVSKVKTSDNTDKSVVNYLNNVAVSNDDENEINNPVTIVSV